MSNLGEEFGIGNNVSIARNCRIGKNVTIGNNVSIHPLVEIGDDCTVFDGAVIGRPPLATRNITRRVTSDSQPLRIGKGSVIGANAVLYTGLTIGDRVLVGDLASIREGCTIGEDVVIGRGAQIMYASTIGERTRIIDGAIVTGNTLIEADVFVGPGVNSINDNNTYLTRYGLKPLELKGPTIRRFALIGAGANLAAGIVVGKGALVAPNAMAIHDVPEWTVVGGIPASNIRAISPHERAIILRHFSSLEQSEVSP